MIRSVEISGLRGITGGKLDEFTPLVILVGPNNSGKSTVLDALLIGAKPNVNEAIKTVVDRRQGLDFKARWLVNNKAHPKHIHIGIVTSGNQFRATDLLISIRSDASLLITGSITVQNTILEDHAEISPTNIAPMGFKDNDMWDNGIIHSELDDISDIHIVDPEMGTDLAPLYTVYSRVVAQGRRKEVRNLLSDLLPEVEDIIVLTEGDKPLLFLEYSSGAIPVAMAGEGIQSLVRTVLELAALPGGVILLEEPEVHQHPAALYQTARAIWAAIRRGIQVFLSTHSMDLIDALLFEVTDGVELEKLSLYRLNLRQGCLVSSRVPGADVAFARGEIGDDLR